MKVFSTIQELRTELKSKKDPFTLIPTMGALHEGHLSLIDVARKKAQKVAFSIFVNPTQFNNPTDLKNYPRDIEKDLNVLRERGVDYVLTPEVDEIYKDNLGTRVVPSNLGEVMEGPNRPGHFEGVCTVVSILFNIFNPDYAVFGEKDFQQMRIIEQMVHDMKFGVQILRGPISREDHGLARSSRNELLTCDERQKAKIISEALYLAQDMVKHNEKNTSVVLRSANQVLERLPELKLEYLTINREHDLKEVSVIEAGIRHRVFFAGYLGKVRLIDNMEI